MIEKKKKMVRYDHREQYVNCYLIHDKWMTFDEILELPEVKENNLGYGCLWYRLQDTNITYEDLFRPKQQEKTYEYKGKTYTAKQLVEAFPRPLLTVTVFKKRIRIGLDFNEALNTACFIHPKKITCVNVYNNYFNSLDDALYEYGISDYKEQYLDMVAARLSNEDIFDRLRSLREKEVDGLINSEIRIINRDFTNENGDIWTSNGWMDRDTYKEYIKQERELNLRPTLKEIIERARKNDKIMSKQVGDGYARSNLWR